MIGKAFLLFANKSLKYLNLRNRKCIHRPFTHYLLLINLKGNKN